jgi:uncharacterized protein YndB with AHSA1/START domain
MAIIEKTMIIVKTNINAPVEKVWFFWTDPKHIIHWNNASEDWHTVRALNDLRYGGKFISRMEARDGSQGFDFSGEYTKVILNKQIFYRLDDGREVKISFHSRDRQTTITEVFEAEHTFTAEIQKSGWQSILNNFKKYVEGFRQSPPEQFEIFINASPEKVYSVTIGNDTYSAWTSEFNPTSRFEGSWDKGSDIRFIGTDKDGLEGGMISKIIENIPNKFISIEYMGILQGGKEISSGPEFKIWDGATENYHFNPENGGTRFVCVMKAKAVIPEEFKTYFRQTWPKALNKLKSLCEQ